MKAYFQTFLSVAVVSLLLLSACGPAPNPKLQAKQPDDREEATAPPAAEQRPAAAVPVEEPRPQAAAVKPKRQPSVVRADTRPPVSAARPSTPAPTPQSAPAAPEASTAVSVSNPSSVAMPVPPPDEVKPVPAEPPPPRQFRVPSGTLVAVRMIDSIDSETAHAGETFKASLDEPIVADNETVFPVGSEVFVKLVNVQSAGRVRGRSELQLQLDRIFLGRKSYLVESNTYVNTGASQTGRTAKTIGVGAAIGAAIGAISGGGKGAVIGGATGAGAGGAVEAIRKGEQVRVESETRLQFRLEDSLEVTLESPSSSSQRTNPSGPARLGTRQR
jgi:hypothetical protein